MFDDAYDALCPSKSRRYREESATDRFGIVGRTANDYVDCIPYITVVLALTRVRFSQKRGEPGPLFLVSLCVVTILAGQLTRRGSIQGFGLLAAGFSFAFLFWFVDESSNGVGTGRVSTTSRRQIRQPTLAYR